MGEVLSQNEIDALLQQLSTGEFDVDQMQGQEEKQVKNYDFSRPTKFSKEHLRTLEIIFDLDPSIEGVDLGDGGADSGIPQGNILPLGKGCAAVA